MPICDTCKQEVDEVTEADQCEACHDAWVAREAAYWRPLYEAEKAAGLLRPQEELDQELRDAGRGHLIRRE